MSEPAADHHLAIRLPHHGQDGSSAHGALRLVQIQVDDHRPETCIKAAIGVQLETSTPIGGQLTRGIGLTADEQLAVWQHDDAGGCLEALGFRERDRLEPCVLAAICIQPLDAHRCGARQTKRRHHRDNFPADEDLAVLLHGEHADIVPDRESSGRETSVPGPVGIQPQYCAGGG